MVLHWGFLIANPQGLQEIPCTAGMCPRLEPCAVIWCLKQLCGLLLPAMGGFCLPVPDVIEPPAFPRFAISKSSVSVSDGVRGATGSTDKHTPWFCPGNKAKNSHDSQKHSGKCWFSGAWSRYHPIWCVIKLPPHLELLCR